MRIVFAAPKYDYGVRQRGFGFEYYNFYEPLLELGHDVTYFDIDAYRAGEAVSAALASTVATRRPDLLFCVLRSDEFDPAAIRDISAAGDTVTFNWFCDDHWRFESFSRHWAPCFHFVSTTASDAVAKYRAAGIGGVLKTQWGAALHRYRPAGRALAYDVTFVGQRYGTRPAIIRSMRSNGLDVRVWGTGWAVPDPVRRLLSQPGVKQLGGTWYLRHRDGVTRCSQDEMIAIFEQSRISVNLSDASQGDESQIKGRTFEIPACRGLLLSGPAAGLEEYYEPGREVIVYSDVAELAELSRRLLADTRWRDQVAEAGYRRTLSEHGYDRRFATLFTQMQLPA